MRFLVISHEADGSPPDATAVQRSSAYRDGLARAGKLVAHGRTAGQRGSAGVYDVESVDELDRLVAEDPLAPFIRSDPTILPLCSYARMAERERELLGVDPSAQEDMAALEQPGGDDMRFLVIAHGGGGDLSRLADAPERANRHRERLMRSGVIALHAHIAGRRGHMWIYRARSADELDDLVSADPMAAFHQADPVVIPLRSGF